MVPSKCVDQTTKSSKLAEHDREVHEGVRYPKVVIVVNLPAETERQPNTNIIQILIESGSNDQKNGGEYINFGDVIDLTNEGSSTNVIGNRGKQNQDQELTVTRLISIMSKPIKVLVVVVVIVVVVVVIKD